MNDPGWDKLVDAIDVKFGIDKHGRHTEALPDNSELTQQVAWITFTKSGQPYKLERIARPAVLDRKTLYHKAASGGVRFENIYDPTNTTFLSKLYGQNPAGDWIELDPSELNL